MTHGIPLYILGITMNWAIVTAKVDPKVKKEAQKAAKEAGVSLSTVIKAYLREFAHTKTITLSADREEIPNARTIKVLKKAEENYKKGNVSPVFDNAKDMIKYLREQGI